jgi:hypothetical protein
MSARARLPRRRAVGVGLAASVAVAALGLGGPATNPAAAQPKTRPGQTCERMNGTQAQPGDYEVVVVITYHDGRKVGREEYKLICGEDGEWHRVAQLRALGDQVSVTLTTVIQTAPHAKVRKTTTARVTAAKSRAL